VGRRLSVKMAGKLDVKKEKVFFHIT
jgi:hypothetical protein